MAKNEVKTVPHDGNVDDFIDALADPVQRDDCRAIISLMARSSGEKPVMWGPSMIGFGEFHYRYASGHEGDIFRIGFSPRKGKISLYLWPSLELVAPMLAKLGRHSRGKGCLYVRRLADIDIAVLGEMIATCLSADPQSLIDEAQGGV